MMGYDMHVVVAIIVGKYYDQKQSSLSNFSLQSLIFFLASSSLTLSGLQYLISWMVTSSKLIGESSSNLRMTSGLAIRLATISSLCLRNLLQMQTGIIRDPNMPKRMKKLSTPSLPRLIWAIIGSFLYSANFTRRRLQLFSIISRCFSPGVLIECSSMSSVTPIFMFSNLILLTLLQSMGGYTSRSITWFTSDKVMFLILESSFCLIRFPISCLRNWSCQRGFSSLNCLGWGWASGWMWGQRSCFIDGFTRTKYNMMCE